MMSLEEESSQGNSQFNNIGLYLWSAFTYFKLFTKHASSQLPVPAAATDGHSYADWSVLRLAIIMIWSVNNGVL